jgi:hypothetical protein
MHIAPTTLLAWMAESIEDYSTMYPTILLAREVTFTFHTAEDGFPFLTIEGWDGEPIDTAAEGAAFWREVRSRGAWLN